MKGARSLRLQLLASRQYGKWVGGKGEVYMKLEVIHDAAVTDTFYSVTHSLQAELLWNEPFWYFGAFTVETQLRVSLYSNGKLVGEAEVSVRGVVNRGQKVIVGMIDGEEGCVFQIQGVLSDYRPLTAHLYEGAMSKKVVKREGGKWVPFACKYCRIYGEKVSLYEDGQQLSAGVMINITSSRFRPTSSLAVFLLDTHHHSYIFSFDDIFDRDSFITAIRNATATEDANLVVPGT